MLTRAKKKQQRRNGEDDDEAQRRRRHKPMGWTDLSDIPFSSLTRSQHHQEFFLPRSPPSVSPSQLLAALPPGSSLTSPSATGLMEAFIPPKPAIKHHVILMLQFIFVERMLG